MNGFFRASFAALMLLVAVGILFFAPMDDLFTNGARGRHWGDGLRGLAELIGPIPVRVLSASPFLYFAWAAVFPKRKGDPARASKARGGERKKKHR